MNQEQGRLVSHRTQSTQVRFSRFSTMAQRFCGKSKLQGAHRTNMCGLHAWHQRGNDLLKHVRDFL